MNDLQRISDYELELMKSIWSCGGVANYAQIYKVLEDKGTPWTKNTIITLLARLCDKDYVEKAKVGLHKNQYTALIFEAEYQAEQTENLLDKVYEGNAKGLVATLIRKELLSPSEYEELKKQWEDSE